MNNEDTKMLRFENLKESDLCIMQRWLNTDFVKEWYGRKEWTYQDVIEKYLPRTIGKEQIQCFMIQYGNVPIGYIQSYFIKDYPDYNQYIEAGDNTAGIDLFIGDKDFIHKGLGELILRRFLCEVVFKNELIESCIVGPKPKNQSAIKAYQKAGFKYLKTVYISNEEETEYIMEIKKSEV